jgi:hypothetical protein
MNMPYILLVLSLLVGCNERYRYPCQDPNNWDTKDCRKPFCSANGTCPEDLQHYEKDKAGNVVKPQIQRGECK